jgi:hypothetical protein
VVPRVSSLAIRAHTSAGDSRLRVVRFREADTAVCIHEMLGEVFAIGCEEASAALSTLAKCRKQVETHGMKLTQVDYHLGQTMLTTRG